MKKIVPPVCDCCGDTAKFESELAGRYCYACLLTASSFMARRGLIESNPLCEILFAGVWRTTDSTYEVVHRTLDYDVGFVQSSFSFLWITYVNRNLNVMFT